MKKIIVGIIIFWQSIGLTQESKFHLGFQFFPNLSTGIDNNKNINTEYYKGIETFVFSFSGGLQIDLNLNQSWSLSSGLLFCKTGDKSKIFPPDVYRGFFFSRQYITKIYYAEIPILISRNIGEHWSVELGVSALLNIAAKRFMKENDNEKINLNFGEDDINLFGMYTNFGIGYRKNIGSHLLKITPYFQFNLFDGIKSVQFIDYFPERKNLSVGLKCSFIF